MLRILILLLAVWPLAAIEYIIPPLDVTGTSNVLTIQQKATGAGNVRGKVISVYCAVSGDVEIERDGTAATSTEVQPISVDRNAVATTRGFTAWSASNVGNGTTLSLHVCTAGQTLVLNAASMFLNGNGTAKNWTIRVTLGSSARSIINAQVATY